nr:uncharacterized protein LOC105716832 [Aotus nancymaae]
MMEGFLKDNTNKVDLRIGVSGIEPCWYHLFTAHFRCELRRRNWQGQQRTGEHSSFPDSIQGAVQILEKMRCPGASCWLVLLAGDGSSASKMTFCCCALQKRGTLCLHLQKVEGQETECCEKPLL